MAEMNRQWQLTTYANGDPGPEHFTLVEQPLPDIADGQLLVATYYFGLDPFPRLLMTEGGALPPLPLGSVMMGRGVGQVIASRHPGFPVGSFVAGELGWQTHALHKGEGLRSVDPTLGPVSTSLGILGPPGLAAYFATRQGQPEAGETVVISGAAGAVGSTAGQIAALQGCRVVGIADGPVKCSYLVDDLGFAAAVDYTATDDLAASLAAETPDGVNVFIDLVGGEMHDAVIHHIAVHGRIVLVGTIASYNDGGMDAGPRNLLRLITRRATMSGFLVQDYAGEFPAALAQLGAWLASQQITYRETIAQGFDQLPAAFGQVFTGEQVGKFLVQVEEARQ